VRDFDDSKSPSVLDVGARPYGQDNPFSAEGETSMKKRTWWTEPGMTSPEAVRAAAEAADVLLGTVDEQIDGGEVPAVIVDAHGGPWVIYPDPFTILGWVAEQVEVDENGDVFELPDTLGWLGSGDLEADRIVSNLLEADELPTDLYHREPPVSTHRTASC
jgi:hypothetical protein